MYLGNHFDLLGVTGFARMAARRYRLTPKIIVLLDELAVVGGGLRLHTWPRIADGSLRSDYPLWTFSRSR